METYDVFNVAKHPGQDILDEREALCHMHDMTVDIIQRAWVDNSQLHPWVCRIHLRASPGLPCRLIEGLGLGDWWKAINELLTDKT